MTKWLLFSALIVCVAISCSQSGTNTDNQRSHTNLHVGDIVFDPETDSADFRVCHTPIYQYYNFKVKGLRSGKKGIRKHFNEQFRQIEGTENETGYITIRFVVNCEGKADRYRVFTIDRSWNTRKFDQRLVDHLLDLTRQLQDWIPGKFEDSNDTFDYYAYLTFKMDKGNLIEILP